MRSSARSTPTSRWSSTSARPIPRREEARATRCELSLRWARALEARRTTGANALFGIVQGGMYEACATSRSLA